MDIQSICDKGTPHRNKRRIGRGTGSGNGKTAGRGHKGWGARSGSSTRPGYEGGQMPLYRRVPKRGFTNSRFRKEYTVINVDGLSDFADGDTVDLQAILDRGLVRMNTKLLKVLGHGELGRKLTVRAQKFSKSAAEKIAAAGGRVVLVDDRGQEAGDSEVSAKTAGPSPEDQE
jgi:large subunit ribosomal protein L15